jgi:hypothetical protein
MLFNFFVIYIFFFFFDIFYFSLHKFLNSQKNVNLTIQDMFFITLNTNNECVEIPLFCVIYLFRPSTFS